jgi:RNA polymerase sigma-70 factor (ECF subfamily)
MFRRRDELMQDALAYVDALHSFAHHLVGNATEAEDLVQETYARALGAVDRFSDGTNLKGWLFRILHNTFIDLYRRRRDRRTDGGLDESRAGMPSDGTQRELEQPQVREVIGREIEAALTSLGDEARLVILLDLEGFSEAEMAALLECPPGTVKSRLYRARASLRERLGGQRG